MARGTAVSACGYRDIHFQRQSEDLTASFEYFGGLALDVQGGTKLRTLIAHRLVDRHGRD